MLLNSKIIFGKDKVIPTMSGTILIETGVSLGSNLRITITDSAGTRIGYEDITGGGITFNGLNFVYNATSPYMGGLFTTSPGFSVVTGTNRTLQINGGPVTTPSSIQGACAAVPLTPQTCYEITWNEVSGFTQYGYATQPANPLFFYFDMTSPFVAGNMQTYNDNFPTGRRLSSTDGFASSAAGPTTVPRPAWIFFENNGPYPTDPIPPIVYSATACCITEDTILKTNRGVLKANEIKPGDYLFRHDGSPIQIHKNVRFMIPCREFVELGLPGSEFLIMENHPIFEDGKEILAKDSINAKLITGIQPKIVHTFITEKRDFIDISGVAVGTWSQEAFDNFIQHDNRGRSQAFTFVE